MNTELTNAVVETNTVIKRGEKIAKKCEHGRQNPDAEIVMVFRSVKWKTKSYCKICGGSYVNTIKLKSV
jgi:hypothetical protein